MKEDGKNSERVERRERVIAASGTLLAAAVALVLVIFVAESNAPSEGMITALVCIQLGICATALMSLIKGR